MRLVSILFLSTALTCSWTFAQSPNVGSRSLPDFSYSDGWLGADDAYSIPIGKYTSIWLFGDTFAGNRDTTLRNKSTAMLRNSIGISKCEPGAACTMNYYWQKQYTAKPRSFFDTGTDDLWYWPTDGYFDGKRLYVSLMAVRNKPGTKTEDAFGFEIVGTKLATVDNALAAPETWHISIQDLTDQRLWAGTSIVRDGSYLLWYSQRSVAEGQGYMVVMRVSLDKMPKSSNAWEYLRNDGQWVAGLAGEDAKHVIDQAISEMSVRYHPSIKKWIALSTGPEFPSTRAVARFSDTPTGPWSSPQTIFEFPEMKHDSPGYDKDTFCYAVKEHIEFNDTKIALTYTCNSFVFGKTMANMDIYRPKPLIVALPK